jgi:hypothetical protein
MPKPSKKTRTKKSNPEPIPDVLKGRAADRPFLGQHVSVAQRWAKEGMPVKRQGRYVTTSPAELNQWLGRESGEPVQVAIEATDLSAELKRGLTYVRRGRKK